MAEAAQRPEHHDDSASRPEAARRRADAVVSRQRILEAAATLPGDRRTTMAEIAAAAGVGRSTLYRLESTERLVLVTDGITERKPKGGGCFGIDGVRGAVQAAEAPTAATTAMASHRAETQCSSESLVDDATLVVLAVD